MRLTSNRSDWEMLQDISQFMLLTTLKFTGKTKYYVVLTGAYALYLNLLNAKKSRAVPVIDVNLAASPDLDSDAEIISRIQDVVTDAEMLVDLADAEVSAETVAGLLNIAIRIGGALSWLYRVKRQVGTGETKTTPSGLKYVATPQEILVADKVDIVSQPRLCTEPQHLVDIYNIAHSGIALPDKAIITGNFSGLTNRESELHEAYDAQGFDDWSNVFSDAKEYLTPYIRKVGR